MDGHVFEEVGLLSEGFAAVLTLERFLPGVGAQVDLDVGLVKEASMADLTMMHHFLGVGVQGASGHGSCCCSRRSSSSFAPSSIGDSRRRLSDFLFDFEASQLAESLLKGRPITNHTLSRGGDVGLGGVGVGGGQVGGRGAGGRGRSRPGVRPQLCLHQVVGGVDFDDVTVDGGGRRRRRAVGQSVLQD